MSNTGRSRFDLSGRTVVVTGGSRGLGRQMVRAFADHGANVVIASRDAGACRAYAQEIADEVGVRATGLGVHVGQWDGLDDFFAEVTESAGPIDVLVNNAGMSPLYDGPASITEALFDKVLDVNLKGPFRLSVLAAEHMLARGGGSIVNISSAASLRPRAHTLPYAAAKAGLNALTSGLAHTYGPSVRVNAIIAGTFLTDVSKAWDKDQFEARAATFAARRGGDPAEITGMAVYLASDASSYTTGALLTVDGGQP